MFLKIIKCFLVLIPPYRTNKFESPEWIVNSWNYIYLSAYIEAAQICPQ